MFQVRQPPEINNGTNLSLRHNSTILRVPCGPESKMAASRMAKKKKSFSSREASLARLTL
ncbi:hypothetical protein BH09PSE2_BH09PSE2_13080 [soil metagenome]